MANNVVYGIEMEGCYNQSAFVKVPNGAGGYQVHNGTAVAESWVATSDSSLRTTGTKFAKPKTYEIIQHPRIGKEAFLSSLREFQGLFKSGTELDQCVEFNKSAGCHVHFSSNQKLYTRCLYEHVEDLKKNLKKNLKAQGVNQDLITSIMEHYHRRYASKLSKKDFQSHAKSGGKTHSELAFVENRCKGLEWRAFNLRGVETWDDFYKVMNAMLDTIDTFLYDVTNYEQEESFVIDPQAIKKKMCAVPKVNIKIPKLSKFIKKG